MPDYKLAWQLIISLTFQFGLDRPTDQLCSRLYTRHGFIKMRIVDFTRELMSFVTVLHLHFRRLWSVLKNTLTTLPSNQKRVSLPRTSRSSRVPPPPSGPSGPSGPPLAGTPAAPPLWPSLPRSPSRDLRCVPSARLRTPPEAPREVSARLEKSVPRWASRAATCPWRPSVQTLWIRLTVHRSSDAPRSGARVRSVTRRVQRVACRSPRAPPAPEMMEEIH